MRAVATALACFGAWIAMCCVIALGLVVLDGMAARAISAIDDWILSAFHAIYVPELREPIAAIGWLGKPQLTMPILILSVVVLVLARDPRGAAHVAATYLGAGNVYLLIAPLVERPRPRFDGVFAVEGWALPSGHVIGIAGVALPIALALIRRRPESARIVVPLAVGAIVVVAATRLYLLQHHPSDILVALMVTGTWLVISDGVLEWGFADQRRRAAARSAKSTGASGAAVEPAVSSSRRDPAPSWPGRA